MPIASKEKLKEEIDRLEGLNIITPVNVATSWISATLVTLKKNGNVRLCVDPKPLNQALKGNHYPLPTIEDVLPELSNARCFTVLDAKMGFGMCPWTRKVATQLHLALLGEDTDGSECQLASHRPLKNSSEDLIRH